MGCYFCKTETVQLYGNIPLCEYYICYNCWSKFTSYIPEEQKWKLIQMRGDKISETL